MNYAFVENGKVVEGPKALPNGWRNVSGLRYMSPENLKRIGWLPYEVVDNGGAVLDSTTVKVEANRVVETRVYREKTTEEVARELEEKKSLVRNDRTQRLNACDWTQLADAPLTATQKTQWANYRQALRDVPGQAGFPINVEWPIAP